MNTEDKKSNGDISSLNEDTWTIGENTLGTDELFLRTVEQLEAFRQITAIVGSEASIHSVLRLISDKTTQVMRAERTTIFLVERDSDGTPCLSSVIAEGTDSIKLRFGQGIAGTVAKKRICINTKDAYKSIYFDKSFDKKTGFTTTSCLTAPIFNITHELIGVIQVINKKNGYFSQFDEDAIVSICAQIGISLTQHRYYVSLIHKNTELREAQDQLRQRNDELDTLYTLERDAAAAPDLDALIRLMLAKCMQTFKIHTAGAIIIENARNRLFNAAYDADTEIRFDISVLQKRPAFLSTVIRHGVCMRLTSEQIETLPEQTKHVFGTPLHAMLIAPLLRDDTPFGALILGSTSPRPDIFPPAEAKLAAIFASHIAPSVRAHIDREADEKQRRLTAIGQMMSSLLHDMKTPLANISGYANLMTRQDNREKRSAFAAVIERQVEKLTNMSAEILQFARGQSAIILRPNDLHAIIAETAEQLGSEAGRRGIRLTCDERYHGMLSCDPDKLQRIIINLARNAFEALGEDGTITIESYADDTHIYIAVRDDGPGIPPDIAPTLFDAFVTSGKRGGTGLGLSIVKKIVDEHNAEISWHPVEPHGTAFIIAFPVDR